MLKKLRAKMQKLLKRLKEIKKLEGDDLTDDIRTERDGLLDDSRTVEKDIDAEIRMVELAKIEDGGGGGGGEPRVEIEVVDQEIYRGGAERALGMQVHDAFMMMTRRGDAELIKGAETRYNQNRKREIANLEKETGFRAAGTGQVVGIASDGGMFLTGSTIVDFMDRGFNNSEVLKRCRRVTLGAGEAWSELIDIDETSREDGSRQGGIRVYTEAELGEYDSSKTSFKKMRVEPKKLTGLIYLSEEVDMFAPLVGQELGRLFENDFAFVKQDQVMEGTGAGTAQGIKSADCKVSVDKEQDQGADTIVSENILNMIQRFQPNPGGKPAWIYNRNCFTQLQTMTYDVGSGGELSKLFVPPRDQTGIGSIWGWPAIPIEQAETLGDAGDIWLTDFSDYIVADKGDVLQAVSMHVKFEFGQIALRFTSYFDGVPRMAKAIAPYKGSSTNDTVSPFVRIKERA